VSQFLHKDHVANLEHSQRVTHKSQLYIYFPWKIRLNFLKCDIFTNRMISSSSPNHTFHSRIMVALFTFNNIAVTTATTATSEGNTANVTTVFS